MVALGVGNGDEGLDAGNVLVLDLLEVVEVGELGQRGDEGVAGDLHIENRRDPDRALESHQAEIHDLRLVGGLQQDAERSQHGIPTDVEHLLHRFVTHDLVVGAALVVLLLFEELLHRKKMLGAYSRHP